MKTRLIILQLMFAAVSVKVASKPFYDSKCMVIGLTSTDDIYAEYRLGGKCFVNEIDDEEIPYIIKGKKILPEKTRQELLKINIGKQVLDYLFERKNGKLSEDLLRRRAWANVQLTDIERAQYGTYSPEIILKEDILPILENNYILIVEDIYNMKGEMTSQKSWIVYHVDITQQTWDEVIAAWNDIEQYDRIQVDVSYVASGKCSEDKLLRQISKKVPSLAVRGVITSRAPYTCTMDMNTGYDFSEERFIVYTQKENAKGRKRSVPVDKVRVPIHYNEDNSFRLFSVAGRRKGDERKGDIAVWSPVPNTLSLTAMLHHLNYSDALRFEVGHKKDYGLFNYIMDLDFRIGRLSNHKKAIYPVGENKEFLLRSPQHVSVGGGCSYNIRLFRGFTVGPYFRVMGDLWFSKYMEGKAPIDEKKGGEKKTWIGLGLRMPLGVKAMINLFYPLRIVGGIEWAPMIISDSDTKSILKARGYKLGDLGFFAGLNYAF